MKILLAILACFLCINTPIFADSLSNLRTLGDSCDPSSTWCVLIKGDNSIGSKKVNARFIADAKNGSESLLHTERTIQFNNQEYATIFANMSAIKQMHVTWIQYQVTQVEGRFLSNCTVIASTPITPGIYTLIISKTKQGDYSCRKL